MQLGFIEIAILSITTLFGILLSLFIIQSIRHHRTAKALLMSLCFGFLAGIVTIIGSGELFPVPSSIDFVFLPLQINMYGFQFFLFYIFLERLISTSLNPKRFSFVLIFFLIQTISLWFSVLFRDLYDVTKIMWFFADLSYAVLGLFIYLIFGFIIYIRIYNQTYEIKPLIFSVTMILIGLGFVFTLLKDLYDFFSLSTPWLDILIPLSNAFIMIGLLIFTAVYVTEIDYLYRLPHQIFMLMVLTKSGIPLHAVKLKTKLNIEIEEDLLSGLISAISNVFEEVFQTKTFIRNISSKEMSLLIEPGEKIVCIIITNKVTFFLDQALRRYSTTFEEQFSQALQDKIQDTVVYRSAVDLLKPIFPFFKVDKVL